MENTASARSLGAGGAAPLATVLRRRLRIGEGIIQTFLFFAGALSIVTTIGIVFVLGRESLLFFRDPRVGLVEFLTGTKWQPAILEFGILPLASSTLITSTIALAEA